MEAQGSRIFIYSASTQSKENLLNKQLADIGYAGTIKLKDSDHLDLLGFDYSNAVLILLLTNVTSCQSEVLDLLNRVKLLPVIGLFVENCPFCNEPVASACDEVAIWPCSNQELDFRIGKLFSRWHTQDLDRSLFVKMNILGNSPEFVQVLDKVRKIMNCEAPVFIDGETGTGKELIARAIHYLGNRSDQPFIATNCGAIPDQLIENEFFGHAKGAYTDARESSGGIIAQAEGGTLFLDEIETLSPKGQVVLLRFLENMIYRPLGGQVEKTANVRIITATNENISSLIEDGSFRKDLFYRVNIMNVVLPPLRERAGDIRLLAEHFVRQYQVQYHQPDKELHPDSLSALKYHDWPGNVRELENTLHREFLLADDNYISITDIESMKRERRDATDDRRLQKLFSQPMARAKQNLVKDFEQQYLSSALDRAKGNISKAARLAGKERRSFSRLLEKYEIDRTQFKTH